MNLKLFKNYVLADIQDHRGSHSKIISYESFLNALNVSDFSTPLFDLWVLNYQRIGDFVHIITVEPLQDGKLTFSIMNRNSNNENRLVEHYLHIPYVYLKWQLRDTGEDQLRHISSKAFISWGAPELNGSVFKLRMMNIYPQDSRICWGNYSVGSHLINKNLEGLRALHNRFFTMNRNNDLFAFSNLSASADRMFTDYAQWREAPFVGAQVRIEDIIGDTQQ